jgi:hypothetical protein
MTPEERARQKIDLLLQQSAWIVQDRSQINLAAGQGVAIREALLKTGEADCLRYPLSTITITSRHLCEIGHLVHGADLSPLRIVPAAR